MRNAQQMYQYCIDNRLGQGLNQKWGVKHFSVIAQALQSDEEIKLCFIGMHNYTSSKHDGNYAYAVTNKRIIMAQQKLIGQVLQSVSLENVNDVTMNIGMLLGVVTIDTIKERFNVGVDKFSAQNISEMVHRILFEVKHPKLTELGSKASQAADDIVKYKNLYNEGVITEEEFEAKKKQLLNV